MPDRNSKPGRDIGVHPKDHHQVVVHGRHGWVVRVVGRTREGAIKTDKGTFATQAEAIAFARTLASIRPGPERRREALRIASKYGEDVVRIVKRMDFGDTVTEREKSVAQGLKERATRALRNHGTRAA